MWKTLAGTIVDWQIRKNHVSKEERAAYCYGYELLLNQAMNGFLAIIIAVLFQAPATVFIFLISYIPIRSYSGGYHARTNAGCTVVSACILIVVCFIVEYVQLDFLTTWYPVMFLISGAVIFYCAPVGDKNKILEEVEIIRYRKISRILWSVEFFAAMILYCAGVKSGMIIALSHGVLTLILCVGKINSRKWAFTESI